MKKLTCCLLCYEKTTARVPIAVMAFLGCYMSYSMRLIFNLAIIAMVYPDSMTSSEPECASGTISNSSVPIHLPDYGPRYNWSFAVQGHVKAAYGYGYFLAHFPGGVLADCAGARVVVLGAVLAQAALTACVPAAAHAHWGAVFAVRFLAGLGGGVIYPAMHALIAQWAPPQEKGKFIFSLMGGTFASVVTWPLVGAVIEAAGWRASFYAVAGLCAAFCAPWLCLAHNSPATHPFIGERERRFILDSQRGSVRRSKPLLPARRALACAPFLALLVAHFGNLWGLFLLTTDTPTFMTTALGFNLKSSGIYGSLPPLGRAVMSLVFGSIVDYMTKHNIWKSKTSLRKSFAVISHLLPGVFMMGLAFIGCNVPGAIALLTVSLAMNGASTVTNLVNHHDLAPNYAGTLYGIMNGVGTTTLWIVPSVTGALLEHKNGMQEWATIFLIGAVMYIATGLIFIMFGSGDIQSWNDVSEEGASSASEKTSAAAEQKESHVSNP